MRGRETGQRFGPFLVALHPRIREGLLSPPPFPSFLSTSSRATSLTRLISARKHTRACAHTHTNIQTHTHTPSHPPSLVTGDITKIEDLDAARKHIDEAEKKKPKKPKTPKTSTLVQSSKKQEAKDYETKPGLRFKKKLWTGADLGMGNPPAAFDWRNAKSSIGTKCRDQINQVYSQGHCGSW